MSEFRNPRLTFQGRSGGWLQRVLLAALGAVLVVAAFFFLTVALIAGAFLALAIGIRWWWIMRRLRAQAQATAALEGEYTVVERPEEHRRPR
jgi:predicted lipid-binding transport protein (Tim44 family)